MSRLAAVAELRLAAVTAAAAPLASVTVAFTAIARRALPPTEMLARRSLWIMTAKEAVPLSANGMIEPLQVGGLHWDAFDGMERKVTGV